MINSDFSPKNLLEFQEKATQIVKEVGDFVYSVWDDEMEISLKDERDMVTAIDIEAEKRLKNGLSSLLPNAGFMLEEGEDTPEEEYNWVIDPIDQTKNYVGKIPLFFIQTALVKNDEPILSIIYNPVSSQVFSASLGNGAFLNGVLVDTKTQNSLNKAVVDVEIGGNYGDPEWKIEILNKFIRNSYRIRVTAGAFSMGILTGGIDAYVMVNEKAKIMDLMPRIGLLKESGLKTKWLDFDGKKLFIAAGSELFDEIERLLF